MAGLSNGVVRKRVTFVIAPALDQGIELYCAGTGRLKNEVAAVALAEFLRSREKELIQVLASATSAATATS
jgi:hypothetical protein